VTSLSSFGEQPDDPLLLRGRDAELVREWLSLFLPGVDGIVVRRCPGGLSGADVFRCDTLLGPFALKGWPSGTPSARVDEVHDVLRRSHDCLSVVPRLVPSVFGMTRLSCEGRHYELASWMPGDPLGDVAPPGDGVSESDATQGGSGSAGLLDGIERGAAVIARFHDSTGCWGEADAPPPAVLRRLGRIDELRRELPRALERAIAPTETLQRAADWLRRFGECGLQAAADRLGKWATRMVPLRIVLRDVHRGHLLFQQGVPSGLVDFDAIGRDTIATDLARWVGDFLHAPEPAAAGKPVLFPDVAESATGRRKVLDADAIWRAAWRGYGQVSKIGEVEWELSRAIAEASPVIVLANWVVWTHLEQRDFTGCWERVDRRVSDILLTMTAGPPFA